MFDDILLKNGLVNMSLANAQDALNSVEDVALTSLKVDGGVATIISNLSLYGYTIDVKGFSRLNKLSALVGNDGLSLWWGRLKKNLDDLTGNGRQIGRHIVYKNFPKEVLALSDAQIVFKQIMIYFGVPYESLTEVEEKREILTEISTAKVLGVAQSDSLQRIYDGLIGQRARWTPDQEEWVARLYPQFSSNAISFSRFGFKENAAILAAAHFENAEISASSGTDVLRMIEVISGGDGSLRDKVRFKKFKRSDRRRLLACLEEQSEASLRGDFLARPEQWKRVLAGLHPGDFNYAYPKVQDAYDILYNKKEKPFSAKMNPLQVTDDTIKLAATRPGELLRRFHAFYNISPNTTCDLMVSVMGKLSSKQIAAFRAYIRTINNRSYLMYPPKGNWERVKVEANSKAKIKVDHLIKLERKISDVLGSRLNAKFPNGLAVDEAVDSYRLQTNDQKFATYGRGTEFDIPKNIKFIRTASYWKIQKAYTWFDNGFNFFDENWMSVGDCGWLRQKFVRPKHRNVVAVFSGDPVNALSLKEDSGKACQILDIYLDQMEAQNIRYAVWNVLCYSDQKFSEAEDVFATLQMGEEAQAGGVFEPSRVQMAFPLKEDRLTSYVAYIDVVRRKIVYMDAPFRSYTNYAGNNAERLESLMPAYQEYLASLPTVLDLVQDAKIGKIPVLMSDKHVSITDGMALVLRPENSKNEFKRLSLADFEQTKDHEDAMNLSNLEDGEEYLWMDTPSY